MTKDIYIYTWQYVSGTSVSHDVFIKKRNSEKIGGHVVTECYDVL